MKFIYLYNLLLEDKIDELIKTNSDLVGYEEVIRSMYAKISDESKRHNKFGKFLNWIINIYNRDYISEYETKFDYFFKMFLKYNINLNNVGSLKEFEEFIVDKEAIKNIKSDSDIKLVFEDSEKYVVKPLNYEAVRKFGASTWCIYQQKSHWNNYIVNSYKDHYIVIYKLGAPVTYKLDDGQTINLRKACIQKDLNDNIFITNSENTVGLGVTDAEADKILKFMKLDKKLFKNYREETIEERREFLKKNPGLFETIYTESELYQLFLETLSNSDKQKLELQQEWFSTIEEGNDINKLQELLNRGIDINIVDKHGNTALHIAAYGYNDLLKLLLVQPNIDINIKNDLGRTPLMAYCKNNHNIEILKLFLSRDDLEYNIQDDDGNTAFIYACLEQLRYIDFIKVLLDTGKIDLNIVNHDGNAALYYTVTYGYINDYDVVKLLLTQPNIDVSNSIYMYEFIRENNIELLKLFIANSAFGNINEMEMEELPILNYIIYNEKRIEIFKYLVSLPSINVNVATSYNSRTPLIMAVSTDKRTYFDILMERKDLDVNKQDNGGRTALMKALYYAEDYYIESLLTHPNIDLYLKDNKGRDAYDFAKGVMDYQRLLVDAGYKIKEE